MVPKNRALAVGAPYSATFSEIFVQSIKFIDILHLAIKENVLGYSCYLGNTSIVYSLMTTDVNTFLTFIRYTESCTLHK